MWIDSYTRRPGACIQQQIEQGGEATDRGFAGMRYPFTLLPLPYGYDALEPHLDAKTMQLHHDKHLVAYIDKLNAALKDHPQYHSWTLEQLLVRVEQLPYTLRVQVRRNAGGVYNHYMYFEGLSPAPAPIDAALLDVFSEQFGSVDAFEARMTDAALDVFGSGYAFLCIGRDSELFVTTAKDQDSPLSNGHYPVLALDVWEHAYYLKHYNARAAYIEDFFRVVDYAALVRRVKNWVRFEV